MKLYHNPRCSKSRQALELLTSNGQEVEVVKYLENPLSFEELKSTIDKLGIEPIDLLRKGEKDFKENFKGKELSNDEWIKAMIDFPKMMERPVLVNGDKAAVGRPPENVLDII